MAPRAACRCARNTRGGGRYPRRNGTRAWGDAIWSLENRRKPVIQATVREHVRKGASVYTDELLSYDGIGGEYVHNVINHAERYVDGQVHTNGCENFWSGLKGTYVSVEPFHLFRYLDEQALWFNNRKDMNDADRFSETVRGIVGRRLTYKELIAALSAETSPA